MDPLIGASLISAGAGLVGAHWSAQGAQDQNRANLEAARMQMKFQERMSNTAVQRRVADLKLAGLNPMLGYMGAASSPEGAMPRMENVGAAKTQGFSAASMAALAITRQHAEIANINADTKNKLSSAGAAAGQEAVHAETVKKIQHEVLKINDERVLMGEEGILKVLDQTLKRLDIQEREAIIPDLIQLYRDDAYRSKLGLPHHENMSRMEKSFWGAVKAFIPGIGNLMPGPRIIPKGR